jgi:cystathionine beta-lyase/cystathionine gamma-synthase
MSDKGSRRIETLAVHGGERRPGPEGSLVFPIYQGTVFSVDPGTDYHDLSFHSATKYLNGHSDLVAGCVLGSAERVGEVRRTVNHYGGSLDPHAGFLLARGLKTLALRVAACNANGLALA